jgi:hypothetical protein
MRGMNGYLLLGRKTNNTGGRARNDLRDGWRFEINLEKLLGFDRHDMREQDGGRKKFESEDK